MAHISVRNISTGAQHDLHRQNSFCHRPQRRRHRRSRPFRSDQQPSMEPPKAPIVNVWSVRKEQLAARATSSNQQPATSEPPLPVSSAKSSSSRTASSRTTGKTATVADIPPVTDKESWPEVAASLSLDLNGKEKENERGLKEQPPKVGM